MSQYILSVGDAQVAFRKVLDSGQREVHDGEMCSCLWVDL